MFPIGQIIGAIIITYLLGALVDWAIFKRTPLPRAVGIIASAIVAMVVGLLLYGIGNADGGPWAPGNGPIAYGIGGIVSGGLRYWRARSKSKLEATEFAEN